MCEGDAGDLQIHRTDAHTLTAEVQKQFGSVGIPWKYQPVGEDFDLPLEFGVGGDLAMRVEITIYFRQPTAHLLLDGDDGYESLNAACFQPCGKPLTGGQVTLQLGEVVCIKNQQFLSRRFAAPDTRARGARRSRSPDRS